MNWLTHLWQRLFGAAAPGPAQPPAAPAAPAETAAPTPPAPEPQLLPLPMPVPTPVLQLVPVPVPMPVLVVLPTPEPVPEPVPAARPAVPLAAWRTCAQAVIGQAHVRNGLPCQDAVHVQAAPRPLLLLSDGAGSAARSELGAQALVRGMARLLDTLDPDLATLLDQPQHTPTAQLEAQAHTWALRLQRHARGLLQDLALSLGCPVRDLRATLLLALLGEQRCYWWQVGDGAIVWRSAHGMHVLGSAMQSKGEFANQTCFVDQVSAAALQYGLLPSADLSGIALMSDGGAEKLVAHDRSRVAKRLGDWMHGVAQGEIDAAALERAYQEPAMWERSSLDDRAIVLAARHPAQPLASP